MTSFPSRCPRENRLENNEAGLVMARLQVLLIFTFSAKSIIFIISKQSRAVPA